LPALADRGGGEIGLALGATAKTEENQMATTTARPDSLPTAVTADRSVQLIELDQDRTR